MLKPPEKNAAKTGGAAFNLIYSRHDAAANLTALRAGEAHVWLSFLPDGANVEKTVWNILSDEEQARAEKIHPADRRVEFVLAHALLRTVLSRYYPVAPSAWQFECDPQGKPFISAPIASPPLQFNLTHTRGLAACAVTLAVAVGVDAECIQPHPDLLVVAREFLASSVVRELENLSGEPQVVRFYEHWTRHEACIKACGGLESKADDDERLSGWRFLQQRVSPHHLLTAAVCSGQENSIVFKLRTADLQCLPPFNYGDGSTPAPAERSRFWPEARIKQ